MRSANHWPWRLDVDQTAELALGTARTEQDDLELGRLNLDDALELTILIAEEDPTRLERAALRWHGRFELEAPQLTLAEAQVALAALRALGPAAGRAVETLRLFGHGRRSS